MRSISRPIIRWAPFLLVFSCSSASEAPSPGATVELDQGVLARVGHLQIHRDTLTEVASAQKIPVNLAAQRVIRDKIFGLAGERELLTDELEYVSVRSSVRARLARAALADVLVQANGSPLTDAEVEVATERHFLELDRPEGFRVIHAVAQVSPDSDEATKTKALFAAQQLLEAVEGASDAAEFEAYADKISVEGIEIRIEELDPVAADGRILTPSGGRLVERFAAAAAKLERPGDQSSIVETEFGFHIIMLLERTPPLRVPLERRRTMLRDEIIATRARRATESLLARLRQGRRVEVERSADALMQSIQVVTP